MKTLHKKVLKQTIFAALFVSAGLFCTGCSGDVTADSPQNTIMSVNVVGFKTVKKDVSDSLTLVGTLEANESVNITSEINGIISTISFKEGQKVKEGDILFQIEKKKLQAALNQAQANLKLAETTAQRYENLIKTKAVSQQEYEQAVATLESNRAAVELANEQLEDTDIIAPFTGVMGERLISLGQFVSQGTLLSYLFSQDPIKLGFHVPERYLGDIELDQAVEMKVAAYKDKTYKGKVFFIDPKINEVTRTALVKAYVQNPSGELRAGMFANVQLIVDAKKDALVIPETALIIKGDEILVYVVKEDQTVELRTIKEGKRFAGMVLITDGLEENEIVVTEGYQKIGPGSAVNVQLENHSKKNVYEII